VKITSKGQVTIPLSILKEFRLEPGTDVEFLVDAGKLVLRRRGRGDAIDEWLKRATGVGRPGVTTSSIMKLTRGER